MYSMFPQNAGIRGRRGPVHSKKIHFPSLISNTVAPGRDGRNRYRGLSPPAKFELALRANVPATVFELALRANVPATVFELARANVPATVLLRPL